MISQLNKTVSAQNDLIQSLQVTLQEKDAHEKVLQEQIAYLTKKLFGTSSEKKVLDIPGQINLFNEAEQEADYSLPEEDVTIIKEHTRKKKATNEERFKGIKTEERIIPLSDEEKICPVCGEQMEYIGKEYVRRELIFVPAQCKVIEYYTESYGCPSCKRGDGPTEKPVIVKSHVPEALIPKSFASSSTVAWTMYQKYVNSIPLYRQEKDWAQYGAAITRTTLANWCIQCSEKYFQPLYDYLHRELVKRKFLMADETRVQVLKEQNLSPEAQSFMLLFRSGEDGLPTIILYYYSETRNGDNAKDFLDGFSGYLESDGFQGYNKVPEIKRCSCWAHLRRYFIDAVPK